MHLLVDACRPRVVSFRTGGVLSSWPYGARTVAFRRGPTFFHEEWRLWGVDGSSVLAGGGSILGAMQPALEPGRSRDLPETDPSAYDAFADAYNAHWGCFSLTWLKMFGFLVGWRLLEGARVLDLCCGTGQMAAELGVCGYRVVGLDGSRGMLLHARENAPDASLIQGDARRFGLLPRFDAIVSMFDSLNHVLAADELGAVFRSAFDCLMPGGVFLFDLNTETGYVRHWEGAQRLTFGEFEVATRSTYYRRRRLGLFRARITRRGAGAACARDVELWQRCHEPGEVLAALSRAGLAGVETYGVEGDALVPNWIEGSERVFYLCERPG